ncbi:hypothetical protein EPN18_09755 [bacterium]|nr:MAG: hypothetical protein EPN18_09755 [bacterium]
MKQFFKNRVQKILCRVSDCIRPCGGWLVSRLPRIIEMVMTVFIGGVICLQIGILHGRALERADIAEETAALNAAVDSLEAEVQKLKTEKTVAEIIKCESGGRHEGVWGDGGKSYGIAQFQRQTFRELALKADMPHLRWTSRADQIELLRWAVDNGYGPRWSCYEEATRG